MTDTADPALLRELFATTPPEFVAARNALAKSLRAEQRKEAATLVAALRRPSWVDWALNTTAMAHGDDVERFSVAAAELRDAQTAAIENRDGPDLRASLRAMREATTALTRRAGEPLSSAGRPPDAADVAARLGEIAASPSGVDQLRASVLGSGDLDEPGPFGDLGSDVASPSATMRRKATTGAAPTTSTSAKGRRQPAAATEERQERER
ncbi:MAG: hypothetical protein M3487_07515, partial [Actinomycetota bacterium]|nr:hypothetical protein [Actinomycetota bacterium]